MKGSFRIHVINDLVSDLGCQSRATLTRTQEAGDEWYHPWVSWCEECMSIYCENFLVYLPWCRNSQEMFMTSRCFFNRVSAMDVLHMGKREFHLD